MFGTLIAQGRRFVIEKSPELFFAGGVICLAAGAYGIWTARPKYEEALEAHKAREERRKEAERNCPEYTPQNSSQDRAHNWMKTAVEFGKIFGPPVICLTVAVVCFGKATLIFKGRYLVAAAAFSQEAKWSAKLEKALGQEKVEELRAGNAVEVTNIGPDGQEVTQDVYEKPDAVPPFTYEFSEATSGLFRRDDPEANRTLLDGMEKTLTNTLRRRATKTRPGYLWLNEVLTALDIHVAGDDTITQEGQLFGWTYYEDPKLNEKYGCDGFVSLGYTDQQRFMDGDEPAAMLHLNCDKTPIIDRCGIPVR